jgi:hypothetical protein
MALPTVRRVIPAFKSAEAQAKEKAEKEGKKA